MKTVLSQFVCFHLRIVLVNPKQLILPSCSFPHLHVNFTGSVYSKSSSVIVLVHLVSSMAQSSNRSNTRCNSAGFGNNDDTRTSNYNDQPASRGNLFSHCYNTFGYNGFGYNSSNNNNFYGLQLSFDPINGSSINFTPSMFNKPKFWHFFFSPCGLFVRRLPTILFGVITKRIIEQNVIRIKEQNKTQPQTLVLQSEFRVQMVWF